VTRDDVLIAGAGPTGLVLALWLVRQGVGVRIVDKTPGEQPGYMQVARKGTWIPASAGTTYCRRWAAMALCAFKPTCIDIA
jgi:2-polyprenyl-6-methoxyphenol hydroxylase-like FAD-dependent oxidoreductase